MRRIGRELGVEAMSLYNHVADKEDLLDGVREASWRVRVPRWRPTTRTSTAGGAPDAWRDMLRRIPT